MILVCLGHFYNCPPLRGAITKKHYYLILHQKPVAIHGRQWWVQFQSLRIQY